MGCRSLVALALVLAAGCAREPAGTGPDPAGAGEASSPEVASASELHPLDPPAGPGALAPELGLGEGGDVLLSWLEPTESGHSLFLSELAGGRWTPPRTIVASEGFFANWADRPGAVKLDDGRYLAHWLAKLGEGTYAYGVFHAVSTDGGQSWREAGLLHDDASPTEHGFVSYTAGPDGSLRAFWLDGRAMAEGGDMQLRTTVLGAEGPGPSELLDPRVCECCSTDAAWTSSGPIVAYRDRGSEEVRDISIVRATDQGWSEPATLHDDGWQIQGCPVNGPAVAARGDRAAIAWFTAAGGMPRVRLVFSEDGGASFTPPLDVDSHAPLGRVDLILDAAGHAVVSWLDSDSAGADADIRWRRVSPEGELGALRSVAATAATRAAGVPRMEGSGDDLIFAWLEVGDPSRLRAARVSLDGP
ncbi:MAG: glycoside hydrolase [Holophagales bacterium]|nr:glycoside hydrolase [Holophagales bacterium]